MVAHGGVRVELTLRQMPPSGQGPNRKSEASQNKAIWFARAKPQTRNREKTRGTRLRVTDKGNNLKHLDLVDEEHREVGERKEEEAIHKRAKMRNMKLRGEDKEIEKEKNESKE